MWMGQDKRWVIMITHGPQGEKSLSLQARQRKSFKYDQTQTPTCDPAPREVIINPRLLRCLWLSHNMKFYKGSSLYSSIILALQGQIVLVTQVMLNTILNFLKYLKVWEREHQHINYIQHFPGGPVVKNLPTNVGDTGSIPGLGISHMPQVPCTTTIEPTCSNYWSPRALEPKLHKKKPLQWAACEWQLQNSPCLPQWEKALEQQWRHSTPNNKNK